MNKKRNVQPINGHVVEVTQKGRIIEKCEYPTYGKAMWGVVAFEEKYDEKLYDIRYRDIRVFQTEKQ